MIIIDNYAEEGKILSKGVKTGAHPLNPSTPGHPGFCPSFLLASFGNPIP